MKHVIEPPSQILTPKALIIRQKFEMAELVGFETRNKYQILDDEGREVGFAAEQQKGFLGLIFRQFLGHWRRFEVHFFDREKRQLLIAKQPFRFIFQRLEIRLPNDQPIGHLQQRFGILRKIFDVVDSEGRLVFKMSSAFFRIWTFKFYDPQGIEVAVIEKKWSGALTELFTDKDNFRIQFKAQGLSAHQRYLLLAAAVFIDLNYFERKA